MTSPSSSISDTSFSVIVPAAGVGARLSAGLAQQSSDSTFSAQAAIPKQYLPLLELSILERTIRKLLALQPNSVCLVVSKSDDRWKSLTSISQCQVAIGGETRFDSVRAGLATLNCPDSELVLVHDAVRPLFNPADVFKLINIAASNEAGGLLAARVVDTLKVGNEHGEVLNTPDRTSYWQAQTPQAFTAGVLRRALDNAETCQLEVTDEASAVEHLGLKPKLVEGSRDNLKITTVEDLALAEFLLQREGGL